MTENDKNDGSAFSGPFWSEDLRRELEAARSNGRVGSRMLSEDQRVRVWLTEIAPGGRFPFHTHVLDYFWTATRAGRARARFGDGAVADMHYDVGTTRHVSFGAGASLTHDLENIGDTVLAFTTVEFLDSANAPLF